MPNLHHYVCEQATEPFSIRPFSAPDSLALTQIVYMPMEGLLDEGGTATVAEVWAFLQREYPDNLTDPFQRKRYDLTGACAESVRLSGLVISDYVNHIDPVEETQFCACTFTLPDGASYLAFRGTDLTLAGWKEDLNMSFMTVPAQAEATAYVERAAEMKGGALLLGGHSKGGHLALYAAAHATPAAQARITGIYSFDGPGMDEATLQSEGYARISSRIESYIPQSSVVGMLLCYHPAYCVVKSNALGLFQHDALTWQIKDGAFETLDGLDLGTRMTDEALRQWIDHLTTDDRRMLTQTVFRLIATVDSETIDPLVQDFAGSSIKLFSAFRKLEPETRTEMRRMMGDLFSSGASEAARTLLPSALRRFVESPAPVTELVEKVKAKQEELLGKLRPER